MPRSPVPGDGTRLPLLRLKALEIAYPGASAPVLRVEDISLDRGSFTCILGRSGCGKTTLLNCIAGLVSPASGEILWPGEGQRRGNVGMVFQEPALFPWMDVLGNITIALRGGGRSRGEKARMAREALATVGLSHCERSYPSQLSGGMKQRVVLARYLAAECELLLMDEPFSGLDQFSREEMQDLLVRLYMERAMTCLFVTHSLVEAVYLGGRVVVLGGQPSHVIEDAVIDDPYPRPPESRVSSERAPVRERLYMALRSLGEGPAVRGPGRGD